MSLRVKAGIDLEELKKYGFKTGKEDVYKRQTVNIFPSDLGALRLPTPVHTPYHQSYKSLQHLRYSVKLFSLHREYMELRYQTHLSLS